MWAFVSNEFQGIVKTKYTLKLYSAIYSYPAFKKVRDEREAHEYIAEKKRSFFSGSSRNMAWIKESGHIRMEYFFQDNSVYANLYTDKFGYVYLSELEKIQLPYGMKIERDLYMPKDCDLIQAMKKTEITPPDYLLEQKENDENLEQNQDENDYDYD